MEARIVNDARHSVVFLNAVDADDGFIDGENVSKCDARVHYVKQRNFCDTNV